MPGKASFSGAPGGGMMSPLFGFQKPGFIKKPVF
jgi:hypothetical protein